MLQVIAVDSRRPDRQAIDRAAEVLRGGGLVAFPTETVYGLGADAFQVQAIRRIFAVKGRPASDPLIVHLASAADLPRVAMDVPSIAHELAAAFWPGPLSLIVPRSPGLPTEVTAGLDTVAVRAPDHPVALALLEMADVPIAAPSANRFGHVSPTTAAHVVADLGDGIDVLLDAGPTPIGIESTVVDCTVDPPRILRPGGLDLERLATVAQGIRLAEGLASAPRLPAGGRQVVPESAAARERPTSYRSPGQLPRHYAPRARLVLLSGPPRLVREVMGRAARRLVAVGQGPVGLLASSDDMPPDATAEPGIVVRALAPRQAIEVAGRALYAALRELDNAGVRAILAASFPSQGLGLAINDRLHRAAAGRHIELTTDESLEAATDRAVRLTLANRS